MLREIVEGFSATTERMVKDLKKQLDREGLNYSRKDKLQHPSFLISSNIKVGVGSEFQDQYTIYKDGKEVLNSKKVSAVLDYILTEK